MVLVSSRVSMGNYSPRHRGSVVGITAAFFYVGPLLFGIIYAAGFSDIPIGNFFLCLSMTVIAVNVLAVLFLRVVPLVPDTSATECSPIENIVSFVVVDSNSENWWNKVGLSQFVLPSFQLIVLASAFQTSVQLVYFTNVTIYIESYILASLYFTMPILGPVVGAIFAFAGGMISDRTMRYTSRLTYLIIGTMLQAFFFLISIKYGDNYYIFIITTLVIYSNAGQASSIAPTLMSEYFGMLHFTRNLGVLLMSNGLAASALGYMFAWFYDDAYLNDSETCIGL